LEFTGPLAAPTDSQPIPEEVQATGIQKSAAVNHSDYIPNADGPPPSAKPLAAARYANLVL
jgi:hypothetical protein